MEQHPEQKLNVTSGSADIFGPQPAHEKRWTIHWQGSHLLGSDKGWSMGTMTGVTGEIYRDEKLADTFRGDEAVANHSQNELTLSGHVELVSADKTATLRCDKVLYDATKKLFHAMGNVRFSGRVGSLGTFPELIATSDLKKAAVPELFGKP